MMLTVPICAYVLCAVTSIICATLLLRSWMRTKNRLLFWSALCFLGLAIDNSLLFYDLVIIPQTDISIFRNLFTLAGISSLIYGLITESGGGR
jgi:hypothetical protein